ncbi:MULTISPECIES: DUF4169 family protein [unclassified Roseivivax]|uniref:DUF4169 family protein n=1 Tax=Roseivivax sp. GX 12232 TaxID=2900547 RepID=UPI001E523856|nr:DUF4169 family protein [Roseivivax sp. GX 12232]MCE0503755.1 DUF4169 family protein [Roseivivax sp. GX 12232]
MSKVTNLKAARKARARAEKRQQGDENARAFGRSKAEKTREAAEREKARRDLDGHRRE